MALLCMAVLLAIPVGLGIGIAAAVADEVRWQRFKRDNGIE